MIINLVDRRTGADGTSEYFHGEQWRQLSRLASLVGAAAWCVDVVLVDDEAMADLNLQYRSKAEVTDVLSFSYLEFTGTDEPTLAGGQRNVASDIWLSDGPETGNVGELVLAPAFIAARCTENDWPLAQEFPLLLVHGCLHLVGWDHADPVEQKAMRDIETVILAEEDLPHPLRRRS